MNYDLLPQAVDNFRCHILSAFDSIKTAYREYANEANSRDNDFAVSFEDFFYDWAQANWELMVERIVCSPNETLVIYGSGSDYEADIHSRVFFHKAEATHEIICLAKSSAIDSISGNVVDLTKFDFDSFVSLNEEWFDILPPFNHILLTEKGAVGGDYVQVVVPIEQVNLRAQKIEI